MKYRKGDDILQRKFNKVAHKFHAEHKAVIRGYVVFNEAKQKGEMKVGLDDCDKYQMIGYITFIEDKIKEEKQLQRLEAKIDDYITETAGAHTPQLHDRPYMKGGNNYVKNLKINVRAMLKAMDMVDYFKYSAEKHNVEWFMDEYLVQIVEGVIAIMNNEGGYTVTEKQNITEAEAIVKEAFKNPGLIREIKELAKND